MFANKMKLKVPRTTPKYSAWPKCEVCQRTAYPQESLIVEQKTYHHGCFKCIKCQEVLSPNDCAMYDRDIYCMKDFNKLIKDSGGSLIPNSNGSSSPTRSNKKSVKLKRRKSVRCRGCNKGAYPVESVSVEGATYHKKCFRCRICNAKLNAGNHGTHDNDIYCKTHLKQISMSQPITPRNMHPRLKEIAKSAASRNAQQHSPGSLRGRISPTRSSPQISPMAGRKSPRLSPIGGSPVHGPVSSAPGSPVHHPLDTTDNIPNHMSNGYRKSPTTRRSKSAQRGKSRSRGRLFSDTSSGKSFLAGFSDEEKEYSDSSLESTKSTNSANVTERRRRSSGFLRRKKKTMHRSRSSSCTAQSGKSAPILFYHSSGAESLQQEIQMERRLHEISENNLKAETEKLNSQIQEQNLKIQLYEQKFDDLTKRAEQQQRQLQQRSTLNLLFDKQMSETQNQQKIIKDQAAEISELKKRVMALEEFTDIQNPEGSLRRQLVETRNLLEAEKAKSNLERSQRIVALNEIDALKNTLRRFETEKVSLEDQIAVLNKPSHLLNTKTNALSDTELDAYETELLQTITQYQNVRNDLERKRQSVYQEKGERTNCVVCKEKAGKTLFLPCLHQRTCPKCSENLLKCPLCRTVIQSKHNPFV